MVKAALGAVLILYAIRQWRRGSRPRKPPIWMATLDSHCDLVFVHVDPRAPLIQDLPVAPLSSRSP